MTETVKSVSFNYHSNENQLNVLGAKFKIPHDHLNNKNVREEAEEEKVGKEDILKALNIREEYWPMEKELELYVGENKAEKTVPELAGKLTNDLESKVLQVKYTREKIQQEYEEAQKVLKNISDDRFLDGDETNEIYGGEKRGQYVQHVHSTLERATIENTEAMLDAHRNKLADLESKYWSYRKETSHLAGYQAKEDKKIPKYHPYDSNKLESFQENDYSTTRQNAGNPFEKVGYKTNNDFDEKLMNWTPTDLKRTRPASKYGNVWETTKATTFRNSDTNIRPSSIPKKSKNQVQFDNYLYESETKPKSKSKSRSMSRSKSRGRRTDQKESFKPAMPQQEIADYDEDELDISPEEEERFIRFYFDQLNKKKISKDEALILVNRTPQLQELYDLKGEALKEEIMDFETKEPGLLSFQEFLRFLKRGGSKNTCLLNQDQLHILEEVFKEADVYEDLVVKREDLVFKTRNDPRVVKFLSQPSVFIPNISKTLTMEKVLDFIEKEGQLGTEENKKAKEYISLFQFMEYFKGYKAENQVSITLLRESKNQLAVKEENDDQDDIVLPHDRLEHLKKCFVYVSDDKGIAALDDVLAQIRKHEDFIIFKREIGRTKAENYDLRNESVDQVITRMEAEAPEFMDFPEFIAFFTKRGRPKHFLTEKERIKEVYKTMASPPQDFYADNDDYEYEDDDYYDDEEEEDYERDRSLSIRQRRLREMVDEKINDEEKILQKKFKANKVPDHVRKPLFNKIMKEQKEKRIEVKKNSVALTLQREKPFSFYKKDTKKRKKRNELSPPKPAFKANDVPWFCSVNLYEQMTNDGERTRQEKVTRRAQETLSKSKLPPRLERHEKEKRAKDLQAQMQAKFQETENMDFKSKQVPNFEEQHRIFQGLLERKKRNKRPTEVKPFKFGETKKKKQALDEKAEAEKYAFKPRPQSSATRPAYLPPSTKKWEAAMQKNIEQSEKREFEARKRAEEAEERESKRKAAAKRFKDSGIMKGKQNEEEVDRTKKLKAMKKEILDKEKSYKMKKKEIEEKLAKRPLLLERATKRDKELERMTQVVTYYDILKKSGVVGAKTLLSPDEKMLLEDYEFMKKNGFDPLSGK